MARALALAALLLVATATALVTVAGLVTPGYDPMARTVSRLAVPGMPAAPYVDLAIAATGVACFTLGAGAGRGRAALLVAGVGFLGASLIHLDPASAASTAGHRAASAVAVLGLAAAPFVLRGYGRTLVVLGVLAVAMLVIGAPLLTTSFSAWGAWERCLLAIQLAWMVGIARKIASRHATTSVPAAMASSTGS
ncbi:MAG TPA: DUF998 domain-containing protein [Candidatus Dormibacteraeota bacterium]|nr:DUF998 domain-containing protein [Candidatus Dormibacteraeota bacterium]